MHQQQLQHIRRLVEDMAGNEYLYFDVPLTTNEARPGRELEFWGASVDPAGDLWLMDGGCNWHPLYERNLEHPNTPHILPPLLGRLREMQKQYCVTTQNA